MGNPYLHFEKTRTRIDHLWEGFHAGRVTTESAADPYESMVVADWSRCRRMGINPGMREGVVLPEPEYRAIIEDKRLVFQKAQQILDSVRAVLSGVPGILMFADEHGTILYITGDSAVRMKAADVSRIVEGSTWLESTAGTNGIGTAIAKRTSVHVYSSEHYCNGWHTWTCAASPVADPLTNELLGVVDFTTIDKDYREDAVGLTHSLASHITTQLRLEVEIERLQLIHRFAAHVSRYPSDAITVADRWGRVVRTNVVGRGGAAPLEAGPLPGEDRAEEIRRICLSGSDREIGTLVVARRPGSPRRAPPGPDPEVASYGGFLTANREITSMMSRLEKTSACDITILLIGETGTGKEMIASYVHERSNVRSGPLVAVNCGAIGKDLFEAKLFGYERGAFTGADPKGRIGLFEAADGGTLFLDEIGELPLDMQAALLRVLEAHRFRRIGGTTEVETHCRIVAATNRPLLEDVRQGRFRADLYYRLSVAKFVISPLRSRPEDIPVIVEHTLATLCRKHGTPVKRVAPEAMDCLVAYRWPGNAREVRNVLESALVSTGDVITPDDLPVELQLGAPEGAAPDGAPALGASGDSIGASTQRHERAVITATLERCRDVGEACQALGISRATLYRKFRALKINPKDYC